MYSRAAIRHPATPGPHLRDLPDVARPRRAIAFEGYSARGRTEEGFSEVNRARALAVALTVLGLLTATAFVLPELAAAADSDPELTATLDCWPIPLEDVGKFYCDDFSFPEIRCYSARVVADSRALLVTVLTSIDYVTVFDLTSFNGASMNVSQDYATLSTIGWNDRISSMKGRNSETGRFFTDWFYSGTWYAFCCNTQVSNLGAYSNSFSSIQRT
jgi:hypothetical protein